MQKMKINYIGVKNILGITAYEYAPGKINIIEGSNGQGKTSFLKALQAVVGGGHDGTLLKKGQTKGEIVLILDNGMTLTKEVGLEKSKVTLTDSNGKTVQKAASFLRDVVDSTGINPIQILTASPKDRIKLLLDTIPMDTPIEEIKKATGSTVDATDPRHPLKIIEDLRKDYYNDRADGNRTLKEKETMVGKMRETVPFKMENTNFKQILNTLISEKEEVEFNMKELIQDAEEATENTVEQVRKKTEQTVDSLRKNNEEAKQKLRDNATPQLEELSGKIAVANDNVLNEDRILKSKEYIEEGEKEIEELKTSAEELSKSIDSLDGIKADLMDNLPIDGLEVKDGDIYLDEIPFDTVNQSKRIRFALTVAGLRDSALPLVCVDGLEALDDESFAIFQKEAEKTDMQFFVTRVTEGRELTINSGD